MFSQEPFIGGPRVHFLGPTCLQGLPLGRERGAPSSHDGVGAVMGKAREAMAGALSSLGISEASGGVKVRKRDRKLCVSPKGPQGGGAELGPEGC